MTTDTPPPRRKWHFNRWLIVLIVATLGWSGWRAYAFRSALSQAKALGWTVQYTDPVERIRQNWKAAFRKETWLDGGTHVGIPTSEAFEQHLTIVHRLDPKSMYIDNARTLRDLSSLEPLTRLQGITLLGCTGLTNVGALKDLSALRQVWLTGCTGLSNVEGLKNLSALQTVVLTGCKELTNVDALKNLPALQIVSLDRCTRLANVDALKNLSTLQHVSLKGCTGLTNADGLKNLPALGSVSLIGSTGLTKESVAALKATLPNAIIFDP